jgi:type IV secretory pathway VirB10-like protein
MGTLVLAAVVFVQPGGRSDGQAPVVPPPPIAEPTFLDQQAPRTAGPPSPTQSVVPGSGVAAGEVATGLRALGDIGSAPPAPRVVGTDGPETWSLPSSPPPPRPVDPDLAAYRAAVAAPLRDRGDAGDARDVLVDPTGAPNGAPNALAANSASAERRWGRQQRFMQDLDANVGGSLTRPMLEPAPGPYAIQAGTMIPAVLLTEIDSDLPGDVLAQVAHDVYDSRAQQTLLIPKGSRLIGTYDSDISSDQRRLFVAWTRLIFPDGRSLALPNLETKDRSGAGGIADRVENHRRRTLGTAALLSLIGAGAQLAQPNGGYGAFGTAPSVGQEAAGAAGQQLAQVTTEMVRKQMDVQPTIRIRQGMPFQVFLRGDLAFSAPYTGEGDR